MAIRLAGDGGPLVRAYVDGREIGFVVMADTDRGSVRQYIGISRRGDKYKMLYRRLLGKVVLEPMDSESNSAAQ